MEPKTVTKVNEVADGRLLRNCESSGEKKKSSATVFSVLATVIQKNSGLCRCFWS